MFYFSNFDIRLLQFKIAGSWFVQSLVGMFPPQMTINFVVKVEFEKTSNYAVREESETDINYAVKAKSKMIMIIIKVRRQSNLRNELKLCSGNRVGNDRI